MVWCDLSILVSCYHAHANAEPFPDKAMNVDNKSYKDGHVSAQIRLDWGKKSLKIFNKPRHLVLNVNKIVYNISTFSKGFMNVNYVIQSSKTGYREKLCTEIKCNI